MQPELEPEGAAPTWTHNTGPGVVMGTVGYMAPEQVLGKATDHHADIFAFGAILYEMLTGIRSFQRPTAPETMTAILNDDPVGISQIAPDIPPGLQRVVHRCLEKNPEQRFHSASDLAFALEALSDSGSAQKAAIRAPSPGWRRRAILWSTVIAVVILSALAYFAIASRNKVTALRVHH